MYSSVLLSACLCIIVEGMPARKQPRPSGKRLTEDEKSYFYSKVKLGNNPYLIGDHMGIGRASVRRLLLDAASTVRSHKAEQLAPLEVAGRLASRSLSVGDEGEIVFPDPIRDFDLLNEQAQQAYKEFGYFRRRYYNRRHIVWQIEMVQILMSWWESGQKAKGTIESGVVKGIVNTAPGGGKSTTITHDFPTWVIARNRDIRIALGARTSKQAVKYTRRVRSTVEKNPLLNIDFGRFKPISPELWRAEEFIVDGALGQEPSMEFKLSLAGFNPDEPEVMKRLKDPDDDIHEILNSLGDVFTTAEKEATIAALSQEMGFLGGRFDLNLWDDLCDRYNSRTPEQREALAEWWFAEAESRCEPGGIVGLIGTRFGKYDLFGHCKNLEYVDDDLDTQTIDAVHSGMSDEQMAEIREDLEKELVDKHGKPYAELATPTEGGMEGARKVYYYHKFPAHDEAKCEAPESLANSDHIKCVLDPKRFSFRHLQKVRAADPRKYQITYQQADETTEDNLVQFVWLTGGTGKDGIIYPGCYDYERAMWELARDDNGDPLSKENCFSIATVDPSAKNWWSIQWWIYDAVADQDYLMALLRARLTSGKLLDWNRRMDNYEGVMEEWQRKSREMGWPVGLWIIEENAAQRYLFQYKWVRQWQKQRGTMIKGHETQRNKADEDLGVETVAPRFMHGLVNLPYSARNLRTRVAIDEFKRELTEYPDSPTDDMVSGYWFLHFNRYNLPNSLRVAHARKRVSHPYADTMPVDMDADNPRHARPRPVNVGHSARQDMRRINDG